MNPSTRAARVLLQTLAGLGVRHVVLTPGSRSAPLAYAVAEAAAADRDPGVPQVDLHVRIDERSAGFLAVGLARASAARGDGGLVAVVTTSGTAVANLHPAVLEAHHAGLPLLLLTADRPQELRGTGANQTTDQVGIFAGAVRVCLDLPTPSGRPGEVEELREAVRRAVAAATGVPPGPVHLNVCFAEPLAPDDPAWPTESERTARAVPVAEEPRDQEPLDWDPGLATVVVAGDGAGPAARQVAEVNAWPLLAEPSSGSRGGPAAVPGYRLLLEAGLGEKARRVVVVGRPTLSRQVLALPVRTETLVISARGDFRPPGARVLKGVPERLLDGSLRGPAGWAGDWQRAGAAAIAAVRRVIGEGVLTGPALAAQVAAAEGPGDVLVVGSSNPVRDLDLVAAWDEPPLVAANRGVSGIDGTVSTAVGLALGLGRPVRAYLGDLTFLHDVGGLLTGPLERSPDLQVVVANDGGGSVFAALEHGAPEHAAVFERVFATPHGADLGALCAGYRVGHVRVTDLAGLRSALTGPVVGVSVVEVVVDRQGRRALHARLTDAVAQALSGLTAAPQ